jgi:hypothetical protein
MLVGGLLESAISARPQGLALRNFVPMLAGEREDWRDRDHNPQD